jgi:hypothetical protein
LPERLFALPGFERLRQCQLLQGSLLPQPSHLFRLKHNLAIVQRLDLGKGAL